MPTTTASYRPTSLFYETMLTGSVLYPRCLHPSLDPVREWLCQALRLRLPSSRSDPHCTVPSSLPHVLVTLAHFLLETLPPLGFWATSHLVPSSFSPSWGISTS